MTDLDQILQTLPLLKPIKRPSRYHPTPEQKQRTHAEKVRWGRARRYAVTPLDGDRFHITGGRHEHIVSFDGKLLHCDCEAYTERQINCAHIMAVYRQLIGKRPQPR